MTTILSDEEFFGTTAPAKPAAPKTNGYLSDDEFFAGSPEKPTAPEPQSDPGLMGGVRDFGRGIARGFNRLQQSGNVLLEQAGLISPEDAAQAIARDEADVARYPASKEVQQGQQEIAKAGGWGSTALAILTNPRTLATIVGESLPASTAMLAVGFAAGMGGRNPVGLVAGTGFASFAIEYSSTILDTMRDAHVDINDPAQVEAAMKDPEFMRRAAERGMKRGIPIGVFDGISFGLAGRISKMIEGGAETISTARKIAGEAGEVGAQAVAGGTGEAGGELADTGTLNPSDVLLEAGAEVFTGLPEIALGRLGAEGEGGAKPERQPASAAPAASVPQGAAPAETLFGQEADAAPSRASSPPAVDPSIDRPDSPRLTPEDRASPLPNNLIDDGKAIIEDALAGRPLPTGEAATVEGTKASVPFMMTNDMRRQLRERGVSDDQIKSMTPAEAQSRLSTKTGSMRAVDEIGDRVAADITSEFAALPDHEVLTTPTPAAEPTPAQAEAGNYQKRHVQVNGLDVSIENEAGSVRRGVGEDGTPWEVTMPVPYGYIKRTAGADGDQVDVYLGPHHSDTVYVIDQIDPATGKFDEHKAMLGFTSETEAVKAYDDAFSDGKGLDRIGAVTAMPTFGFKHWVKNGDTSGPLSYTPKAPQAAAPTPASPEPTPVDVRDRKVTRKTPLDLIEFVASLGGIKDVKGELRALDLHKKFVPGIGRLVRESGLDPDKAREAAEEAGYISPTEANFTTTTRDLFDAMERTARGDRVFARSDMAAVERGKAGKVSEEDQAREAEWEEVRALGLSPDEEEQIKALVGDGWWPSEAAAEVLGRDAAEEIGRPIEEFIDEEIPFEPGQARGGAEGEKPVGRSAPADEAPKEGGAAGRGKQDAPRKIENAGAVARDEVLKRGRATGNEHLMLISPDGSSAFELAGSPTNTGSSPEMFKVMNDPASDVIAHHNHPSSRSLSNSDVSFLVRPGMSAVWAHGHDGTSSRASFTDKAKKVFTVLRAMATANGALALAQETLQKILPRYEGRSLIYEAINLRFQAKEISADDASVMESVARNEALHRAGLIDFFTTIPRHAVMDDPLIQTAIERQATNVAEQIFGNDAEIRRYDRPAIPIRHAGDVGVVQEGGREPAANRAGEGAGRDQKGGALGSFGTVDAPNVEALGKAFGDYLVSPANRFNTIVQARNFAAEKLGGAIKAGTPAAKAIDEAIELGVVRAAREIVEAGRRRQRSRIDIFNDLLGLYDRQPSLAVRTSTSVQNQAYSTPVPLAYVASRLALVDKKSSVLEPTAGNGALLIEANPEKTTANELDPARAAALTSQGFRVSQKDAAEGSLRHGGYPVDVVIANPPFGAVQENGASKRFKVDDRYTTTEIDHAIALKSLEAMADDGRAVLLLGGVNKLAKTEEARSDAYNGKAKREFYYTLYNAYNVVDHFTVSGDLYQKQGAGWPIDVIVIRGKGKSARKLPAADVPRVLNSWEDVKELLHAEYPETARPAGQPSERPAGKPAEEPATQRNAQSEAEVRGGGPAVERDGDQGGRSAVVQPRSDERGAVPEDQPATVAGDGGAGSEDAGADSGRADVGIAVEADDSDEVVNQRMTAEGPWDFNDTYPEPDWEKLDAAEREGRYPLDTGEGPDGRPDATQIAATIEETMQELQVRNLDMAEANRRIEGLRSGSIKPRKRGGKVEDEIRGLERSIKEDQQAIEDTEAALGEVWPDDAVQAIMVEARRRAGVEASQTTTFEGRVPKAERKADEPEAPKPAKPEPKAAPDAKQVSYKPKSAGKGMGTLVPVNMQSTTQAALDTLEERVGPLDNFVGKELGYSKAELDKYFGAEQIDGIALAIDNFSKGAGFIIGDQTGIGKGRQVAAVLRWAMRNGKTPIFVTEKPNLYGDMYRDLTDIGVKNPRIFMTNSGENIPLNEEQTVSLKTPSAAIHNAAMNRMAAAGKLDDKYDLIFTTYNQMQTIRGEPTARMTFLRAMATANGALALDESHNAGGTEAGTMGDDDKMTRAKFVRELVGTADAVLYSSATYAKRPSVMDLYAKTDMRLAVDDIGKLGDLIARGGVPMQQIVAAQLSQAGQYARRERSFDGVVYDSPVVEVNKQTYERFSSSIKMIQTFSEDFVNEATKGISKELKADAKSVSRDGSTGGAGASSTNFTAIMHNVINQMLLAIKADTAVDYALDAIKRGEKPVITLANTLESFLDEYADTRGLRPGDALSLDFGELLQRYLDRSRVIIIKKPFSKEPGTRHRLTDEELGPMGVRAYEEAKKQIAGTDFGKLPVSPIDWIKARLTREGVKVGEITGRNMIVDYRADGAQILAMRPSAEKSITGRRKSIADFNNGNLDVLILNQAGATGLSLHASEKVKDQRKRHMILAQAEGNIDTHMQMLGRVHRTGQVVTPRYSQLVAGIPAEKRPASVLAKKMASLNANTTASRGGALTAKDVPDFMNEYGDQVAARVMNDNPDLHEAIGEPLEYGTSGYVVENAMRKVTGRIPLLPLAQQEALYEMLESEYAAYIEQLEASGENALEAKTLPLDARTIEHRQVKEPVNADSPFADGVYFDKVDVKQLGKPQSSLEVLKAVAAELAADITPTKESAERDLERLQAIGWKKSNDAFSKAREEFTAYRRDVLDNLKSDEAIKNQRTKLDDILNRWNGLTQVLRPGVGVKLMTNNIGNLYGIVISVSRTGTTKNPLAMGAWKVKVALADSIRQITLPFSTLYTARTAPTTPAASDIEIGTVNSIGSMPLIRAFDDMQQDRREERTIVTGNILAGYDMLNGRGQIINYVDHENAIRQGILLKRDFDQDAFLGTRPVKLVMSDHILRYLEAAKEPLYSTDRNAGVRLLPNGDVRIITDGSKAKGGQYFLNRNVLDAAGRDFVKAGGEMRLDVPPTTALRVLDAMKKAGASFEATTKLDIAREITGERGPMAQLGERTPETTGSEPSTFRLKESFKVRAARIGPRMRAELDRIGLKDVGLRLAETLALSIDGKELPANGVYFQKLIQLALDQDEPTTTLHHEVMHALRDLGLFTKTEWAMLERKARKEWMTRFDIADAYGDFPEWAQMEEAIAHAFAEWKAGRMTDGMIARLFKRIVAALRAIRAALTGEGFRSVDEIFEAIDRGKIGNRPRPGSGSADVRFQAAWHGTPHEVDRFSMEKIGTGEGNQSFGWGLYFAGKKEIAEHYRNKLSSGGVVMPNGERLPLYSNGNMEDFDVALGEAIEQNNLADEQFPDAVGRLTFNRYPSEMISEAFENSDAADGKNIVQNARSWMEGKRDEAYSHLTTTYVSAADAKAVEVAWQKAIDLLDQLEKAGMKSGKGSLYKVDLPEDDELMLWDAPLSEQPEGVREKLLSIPGLDDYFKQWMRNDAKNGDDIYDQIGGALGGVSSGKTWRGQVASKALRAAGIPGHKYLDGGSRAAGKGSYNYVIYDDSRISIQERFALRRAQSEMVNTEDGKREQLVIPGAEKISDKKLAERRGEGKMQPTKPQKGVEGLGLFDDGTPERGQLKLFKLRRAPKGSAEAQEAMQGFIARGQPIDRAIRIPFDILGGIDEQGRWMPGKRLMDKLGPAGLSGGALGGVVGAGVGSFVAGPVGTVAGGALGGTVGAYLLGAKINTGTRFPWLDGVLENFRRGLIDRYGLDADYVDMDRKRALDQRAVLQQADGILKVLANSNVGPKEAAVLQAILTGERVDDRDMALMAVPIRQAIDDLGAEAVSLGLISAESFERNRGAYLHRVYQKNEIEDGTLAGWVSRRMTSRRRRIMGDEMKGRGMFWDLSVDRLMRDVPGWKEAARGTPVNGEKFRVLDNVLSPTDDMLTGEERGRVARRIYLPADEMVPPKYTGPEWRDRGVWEVRGTKKGQVTLWRDYTKAEREKMGEIVDARYTIAKTFMLMANDLSTGRFFKQVGENENWARSMQPPDGQWKTAEAYSRYWNDTSIGWVKVPDTVISGAGGRKRWGGLAGKYVRAEIWRDLNELDIAQNPGTWRRLYQQWKRNKTARNPVVHMNNIMSNLMFMDLADVRLQDLVAGIKAYHSGGKDFQEARDNGAFGADMMTQEIRDNVLKPILEEIAKQAADGRSTTPFLEKAGALGVFADKLWTWAKTADEGMLRAYQIEDEIFRMATYMRRRQQGETPRVAAMNAHDQFLNYDIRAPWIVAARNTVFPFISYTYRAVPKLAEGIAHRPWKVAKYFALAYIANALAYAGDDGDDGEDRERAALRDEEQGWTWIGVPRMVRMPFRDEHGLPVFLDVRRWIPAGDIFDTSQGSSAIPIPAPLQFGGPMVLAAEFLLNRQAFTGGDITNDLTDDNADKAENVADWAWKSWAPNAFWVPNSWYWQKVRNAVVGATDAQGRQYSVGQAFLSSIGVKVRPLDVEDGLSWHSYEFKQVQKALRAERRAAGRKRDRGLISQAEYDRQQAKIMEKFANLERTADEFEARSQPKR